MPQTLAVVMFCILAFIHCGGAARLRPKAGRRGPRHRRQDPTPDAVDVMSEINIQYQPPVGNRKGQLGASMQYLAVAPIGSIVAAFLRADGRKIEPGLVDEVHAKYPENATNPASGYLTVVNDGDGSAASWIALKGIMLQHCELSASASRNADEKDTKVALDVQFAARLGNLHCGTVNNEGLSRDMCGIFFGTSMIHVHTFLTADFTLREDGTVIPVWKKVAVEIVKFPTRIIMEKNKVTASLPFNPALQYFAKEARREYEVFAAKAGAGSIFSKGRDDLMRELVDWESTHFGNYVFATPEMFYSFKQLALEMEASMSIYRKYEGNDNTGFRIQVIVADLKLTVWDFEQSSGNWQMRFITAANEDNVQKECRRPGQNALRCFHIEVSMDCGFHMDLDGQTSGYTFEIHRIEIPTAMSIALDSAKEEIRTQLSSLDRAFASMLPKLAQLTLAHHKGFRGDFINVDIEAKTDTGSNGITVECAFAHDEDVFGFASDKVKPVVQLLGKRFPPGPWTIRADPMSARLEEDLRLQFGTELVFGTPVKKDILVDLGEFAALLDFLKSFVVGT